MTEWPPVVRLLIPHWHPIRLNQIVGGHWARGHRLKRVDRELVAAYAAGGASPAIGPRRVRLTIVLGPRQRAADPDAYWKSLLDALVHAGLLLDDNRQNCELEPVRFERGERMGTVIELFDLEA
jgi:hypothetical protein